MKMLNNQLKEDNVKLKTKIKILENELGRKEKTIEDLFSHNQMGQQHPKQSTSNQQLMPLASSAQKYQQETFLVMSLKKQIRELKNEVGRRDEELDGLRKNIQNSKTQEFESELAAYSDECLRLRNVLEEVLKQGAGHPIHQQPLMDRVSELENELMAKDHHIQHLTNSLHSANEISKPGTREGSQPAGSTTNIGMKQSDSQRFEQQNDVNVSSSVAAAAIAKQNPIMAQTHPQKDVTKELQKTKKTLRDKEKEITKLKQENA